MWSMRWSTWMYGLVWGFDFAKIYRNQTLCLGPRPFAILPENLKRRVCVLKRFFGRLTRLYSLKVRKRSTTEFKHILAKIVEKVFQMQQHWNTIKPFSCEICEKWFTRSADLIKHRKVKRSFVYLYRMWWRFCYSCHSKRSCNYA